LRHKVTYHYRSLCFALQLVRRHVLSSLKTITVKLFVGHRSRQQHPISTIWSCYVENKGKIYFFWWLLSKLVNGPQFESRTRPEPEITCPNPARARHIYLKLDLGRKPNLPSEWRHAQLRVTGGGAN